MGLVAVEKERSTAALMLSKPLSRNSFIISKFLGVAVLLLTALLVAAIGGYYYTLFLFEPLPVGDWLALNGALLLVFLVVAAITLLFSTLFNSQAAAAGAGLGLYLLISLLGNSPTLAPYTPGYLVNWGVGLFTGGFEPAWGSLGICLGLIVISLTTACLVFKRQEL
jgi:ABC-2 type transport system permease protein